MSKFKEASVHELYCILQFVDTKPLKMGTIDFVDRWATEGSYANEHFGADVIIRYLQNDTEVLNGAEAQ